MSNEEPLTFFCTDPATGELVEQTLMQGIINDETQSLYIVFAPYDEEKPLPEDMVFSAARVDSFPQPGQDMTGKLHEVPDGPELDFVSECFNEMLQQEAEGAPALDLSDLANLGIDLSELGIDLDSDELIFMNEDGSISIGDMEGMETGLTITLRNEEGETFDCEVLATATNEETGCHYLIFDSGSVDEEGAHEIDVVRTDQLPDEDGFDPNAEYRVYPIEDGEETEFVQALLEDLFGDDLV